MKWNLVPFLALLAAVITSGSTCPPTSSGRGEQHGTFAKEIEIHYQQVANCKEWSDQDDPALRFTAPLVVFRLVSVSNHSPPLSPPATFELENLIYQTGEDSSGPEITRIPNFTHTASATLTPGRRIVFPQPTLFCIQLFGEKYTDQELARLHPIMLKYRRKPGDATKVILIHDPGTPAFHAYADKATLSRMR